MGELIPFPQPERGRENIQVEVEGDGLLQIEVRCQGHIHIFGPVPGHCLCGRNYWSEDEIPELPVIGIREA
jgi:hypothetical protein